MSQAGFSSVQTVENVLNIPSHHMDSEGSFTCQSFRAFPLLLWFAIMRRNNKLNHLLHPLHSKNDSAALKMTPKFVDTNLL